MLITNSFARAQNPKRMAEAAAPPSAATPTRCALLAAVVHGQPARRAWLRGTPRALALTPGFGNQARPCLPFVRGLSFRGGEAEQNVASDHHATFFPTRFGFGFASFAFTVIRSASIRFTVADTGSGAFAS